MKIDKIVKGIILLISYPIYPISFLFPKNKKKWLFGSFGKFNDNSRYLFEHCIENEKNINVYWVSKNKNEYNYVRELKLPTIYKYSLSGLFHLLTSKVYIYSSYVNNVSFFTSGNTVLVNLWHGIPLKKIEFDIETPPLNKYFKDASLPMKILYPHHHKREKLLLCPGDYLPDVVFKSAFRKESHDIIDANYPRTSLLRNNSAKQKVEVTNITYAPTWRDNNPSFIKDKLSLLREIDKIAEMNKFKFNIKLHPNSILSHEMFSEFNNINLIDNKIDPIDLLLATDCLITDYSSIYFDFLHLNRPIIFFQYDKNDYFKNRELYSNDLCSLPGYICQDDNDLIQLLSTDISPIIHEKERESLLRLISSKNNSDYIVKRIKERI